MFKIYRYFFYQFYSLSTKTEKQWPLAMRTPKFTANLTFSMYSMIMFFCIVLLFITRKSEIPYGAIPGLGGVIVFFFNYFVLFRTGLADRDKIQFDNAVQNTKKKRRVIFFSVFLLSILTFVVEVKTVLNKTHRSCYLNAKKIKIGDSKFNLIQSMGHYHQALVSIENLNDSIYYYEFDYNNCNGVEFYFDSNTKKVKRIFFHEGS